jgi:hypothetical protein
MKLLSTVLCLAVLAYACQNIFTATQKVSEKDAGQRQALLSGNEGQAHSFTVNSFDHIFLNTEKLNLIVLTKKILIPKDNAPVTGSINVEMKEMTTAKEIVLNKSRKQSHNYPLFPAVDILFGSLLMVN